MTISRTPHVPGPRLDVYNALRLLEITIVEQLTIYTGLTTWQVQGTLRRDRYTWCDLVDSCSSSTGCSDVGVWQYMRLKAAP